MALEEKIQKDLMLALKNKEEIKLGTLRGVKTAIMEKRTSAGFSGELTDADVIKIMQKMAKERKEVAKIYMENNRTDLAEKELAEASIIDEYLPLQMSEEEIENVVKSVISEVGATSIKDMGKVMGSATKKLAGQADGKIISNIVKKLLN